MSILDPKQDAAALESVLTDEETKVMDAIVSRIVPALKDALVGALDGLTITIVVSKKQ